MQCDNLWSAPNLFCKVLCTISVMIFIAGYSLSPGELDHAEMNNDEEKVFELFRGYFSENKPGAAIAIIENDEIQFKLVGGLADLRGKIPLTFEHEFYVSSVSMQFTGYAVALLVEKGQIEFEAPITRYLKRFPKYGDDIRVEELLFH